MKGQPNASVHGACDQDIVVQLYHAIDGHRMSRVTVRYVTPLAPVEELQRSFAGTAYDLGTSLSRLNLQLYYDYYLKPRFSVLLYIYI